MRSDTSIPFDDRIGVDQFPVAEALVLSLSALLWLVLFEGWLPALGPPPAGPEAPMNAPGVPELLAVSNGLTGATAYLLMWGTMTLAMMLPSLIPVVRRYREELCDAPSVFGPSIGAFLGGYGLAWTLVGTVPLAVEYLFTIRGVATVSDGGSSALLVGVLSRSPAATVDAVESTVARALWLLSVDSAPTVDPSSGSKRSRVRGRLSRLYLAAVRGNVRARIDKSPRDGQPWCAPSIRDCRDGDSRGSSRNASTVPFVPFASAGIHRKCHETGPDRFSR